MLGVPFTVLTPAVLAAGAAYATVTRATKVMAEMSNKS
jgi:hypothetical protein